MKRLKYAGLVLGFLCISVGNIQADEESLAELVEGNRAFAFALHKALATGEENLFYSPYSISTALAMTYAGSREETEIQMAEALRFPFGAAVLSPIFGELQRQVRAVQSEQVALHVANSLWPSDTYEFDPDYLRLVQEYFQSDIHLVDYDDAEAVRLRINTWVEEATRNKIQQLIPAGSLNAMTRMVLANAVYFKGSWSTKFPAANTKNLPFYPLTGDPVTVPLMHHKVEAGYGEMPDGTRVLELPYEENKLAMMVVLPASDKTLPDLEAKLTARSMRLWDELVQNREVNVYLPRFTMTRDFNLSMVMKKLGMTDAFDASKADFSGMDGLVNNLFISEIIHKAFVEVNEEGTEAAAATAVIMRTTSFREEPPVPEFRADRPFLFLIKDRTTGSLLFAGRYMKP